VRGATTRKVVGGGEDKPLHLLFVFIGLLQFLGDGASVYALLLLLEQPDPPFGLAIGYWLTTLGFLVLAGWVALEFGLARWIGEVAVSATVSVRSGLGEQSTEPNPKTGPKDWFLGLCGILVGGMSMLGAWLVIIALPQLFGFVCGLACLA
jgi:hypothetical protein